MKSAVIEEEIIIKNELNNFFESIHSTLNRSEWLDMENVTNEEQGLLDELFVLSVQKLVDFGHMVLMEWDSNETVPPKKRKTNK